MFNAKNEQTFFAFEFVGLFLVFCPIFVSMFCFLFDSLKKKDLLRRPVFQLKEKKFSGKNNQNQNFIEIGMFFVDFFFPVLFV